MALHKHGKGNPSARSDARGKALQRVLLEKDLNPAGKPKVVARQLTAAEARKKGKSRA